MNFSEFYSIPEVTPAMLPDNPTTHKPSDHGIPILRPLNINTSCQMKNQYSVKRYRLFLTHPSVNLLPGFFNRIGTPTEQVNNYLETVNEKVEELFPEKTVKL